jgi:hypothetical protein
MMEKAIEKTERMIKLLKELEKSKEAETKDYHLVRMDDDYLRWGLVDLKTELIVVAGPMSRIKSYLTLRGIDESRILKD